jgi:hypothetical protein
LRVGDLVLSVDGVKVADSGDLIEAIQNKEGKTVDIDLARDKKAMHVKALLPKLDDEDDLPRGRALRRGVSSKLGRVAASSPSCRSARGFRLCRTSLLVLTPLHYNRPPRSLILAARDCGGGVHASDFEALPRVGHGKRVRRPG